MRWDRRATVPENSTCCCTGLAVRRLRRSSVAALTRLVGSSAKEPGLDRWQKPATATQQRVKVFRSPLRRIFACYLLLAVLGWPKVTKSAASECGEFKGKITCALRTELTIRLHRALFLVESVRFPPCNPVQALSLVSSHRRQVEWVSRLCSPLRPRLALLLIESKMWHAALLRLLPRRWRQPYPEHLVWFFKLDCARLSAPRLFLRMSVLPRLYTRDTQVSGCLIL
mmetsp:Transcript_50523/g.110543  ORF Transcript_50523/g.110543 Transcript_50523/m.110543 type:complete len:227 (-) Transcript_50523:90-770(-)